MALTNENGGIPATMLVGPTSGMPYYAGQGSGGFGLDNGNGWWIILLFILLGGGNWGPNYGNGGGNTQRGFDQASVMSGINGVQSGVNSGFSAVQNALCSGFAGVNATVNSGVNAIAQQLYSNQIADMQNSFALQSQFANCCCENRLATANLGADIAREACADRAAGTANTQVLLNAIKGLSDQICQDKIDAKNEEIARLRQEVVLRDLAASQNAQTAAIQAGQRNLANEVEQYVLPTPRPAYIVQNPNCCQPNACGCGGF